MRHEVLQSSQSGAAGLAFECLPGSLAGDRIGVEKAVNVKRTLSLLALALLAQPASAQVVDNAPSASATTEEPAHSCADVDAAFVMPTTGAPFSLPLASDELTAECADPGPPPPVRPPDPSLFNMAALPIGSSVADDKWQAARQGSLSERNGPWDELLEQANRVTAGNPLSMVNQWVNWHVRYRADVGDEWSTSAATLTRGYGDCEDFAVAKMGLLLALGVPADDMYLVLLRDRQQVQHAVLAVKREGRLLVLDNRTDKVLPAEAIDDYKPIMSFSGPFAWTYGRLALR